MIDLQTALLAAALLAMPAGAQVSEPAIYAHRGRSAAQAENSLPAFRAAIALGVDGIELDLRTTRDGELVVLHDPTLDRTVRRRGRIANLTMTEIRALPRRPDGSAAVPVLAEVLALARATPVRLLLDIKQVDGEGRRRLVALVREAGMAERVTVGVRTPGELRAFRALAPDLRLLGFVPSVRAIPAFAAAGADAIRLWSHWTDAAPGRGAALIARVRGLGREAWIMVEERSGESVAQTGRRLETLRASGADALVTDHPELLIEVVRRGSN